MAIISPVKETSLKNSTAPAASNPCPSLVDSIPLPLVMFLAAPYLAGRTSADAIARAHKLWSENRFASTIDILGEDATTDSDCQASVEEYKKLADLVAANKLPVDQKQQQITISFKPSMFSTLAPDAETSERLKDLTRAQERIADVVAHCESLGLNVTLEAEDYRWTDFHLDTYFELVNAGHKNVGTVLQSRLFRTKRDLARFDERCRVRMVIGIYIESPEIAYTAKPEMKELAVDYACELLCRGTYVELASHDTACLSKFLTRAVIPQKAGADRFETQYLLGVPRLDFQKAMTSGQLLKDLSQGLSGPDREHALKLAEDGVLVRMYLPYGTDRVAGPYCKRRLKANPNMMAFGIKNLFHLK